MSGNEPAEALGLVANHRRERVRRLVDGLEPQLFESGAKLG